MKNNKLFESSEIQYSISSQTDEDQQSVQPLATEDMSEPFSFGSDSGLAIAYDTSKQDAEHSNQANASSPTVGFTQAFESQLNSLYSTTVFNTEDSDIQANITTFHSPGGSSTYSFGL